jgi:hypothetical protein
MFWALARRARTFVVRPNCPNCRRSPPLAGPQLHLRRAMAPRVPPPLNARPARLQPDSGSIPRRRASIGSRAVTADF